jgi:hypothetical protein
VFAYGWADGKASKPADFPLRARYCDVSATVSASSPIPDEFLQPFPILGVVFGCGHSAKQTKNNDFALTPGATVARRAWGM